MHYLDYLVKNGTMESKIMFDTPFTNINDQGIAGVFDDEDSQKVISLVKRINRNARLADDEPYRDSQGKFASL